MKREVNVPDLVRQFADSVATQTMCIAQGDARTGNRHAKRRIRIFEKLRGLGDAGRDALLPLLRHERADVRTTAAAYLLRYRTAEARAVLEAEARGKGFDAFAAQEALKRWDEGTWSLDP